ncbi:DUF397 domain-containing protein [Streptomyces halstedii]
MRRGRDRFRRGAVRDSKNAAGPRFAVAGPAWADFLAHVAPR